MTDYSKRYFQLTEDILVEYNYASEINSESKIDITSDLRNVVFKSTALKMPFYVINEDGNETNLDANNFVIQTNKSETKFIKPCHYVQTKNRVKKQLDTPSDVPVTHEEFAYNIDNYTYSLDLDKIRFHFTSRNFWGSYDGFIFQIYVYNKKKEQIGLASFKFHKDDDKPNINEQPILINQKYYTQFIDVKIPCVYKLLKSYTERFSISYSDGDGVIYGQLKDKMDISYGNNELMSNSPICIKLYGIKPKSAIEINSYTYYSTENISKITIPNKDRYDSLYVDIREAVDGDYFVIAPKVSDGISFADFMNKVDDNLLPYIVLHEVTLTEHYVDKANVVKHKKTHTEQYIINVISSVTNESDDETLNTPIYYRPVCQSGTDCFKFTIEDTLRIINTSTNVTIEKKGTLTYSSPAKYGLKMRKINLSETPPVINVYNKRIDMDIDADTDVIRITNGGGTGPKIETQLQQIVSFIETINVQVAIQQLPASLVEFSD